jgi:hypothetical protein
MQIPLHILDLATAIGATTARFAHLIVVAQAGDQFALEFATRVQIDRKHPAQPPCN